MEPITLFAASVGLIATCHITFSAAKLLGMDIYSKGSNPAERDDWYCFFKTSDLLNPYKQQTPATSEREQLERRRRQQQQRPRLQA